MMDESWKNICVSEPVYVSVTIACGLEESETLTHSVTAVTVRHREMVVRSTLVQVFLNGVSVVALVDGGSDINLMGPRLVADNPQWKTQKSNVGLNFGNASQGTATRAIMNNRVSAGNVAHTVDFFVSSQEIPGCDIILGTPFLTYAKAVVEHDPTQAVLFPGNQRWHSLNVFPVSGGESRPDHASEHSISGSFRSTPVYETIPQGGTGLPGDGRRVTRHCNGVGQHAEGGGTFQRGPCCG